MTSLYQIPPDLQVPALETGDPAAGKRVRMQWPEYAGTQVHHALYLPADWQPGRRYPVIVEYAGNGGYHNELGDTCPGTVEGSNLGYGIGGGQGFIWACLPYVGHAGKSNASTWWGNVKATVDYCKTSVARLCDQYGGDANALLLCGFSRGAIACNYIGLHDDEIARLWAGFIAHSHYDGVHEHWGYPHADRASALRRLQRLRSRPVWHSHETSVEDARAYLAGTGLDQSFTLVPLPYPNHTDTWVLRDIPERTQLRDWIKSAINVTQPDSP